MAEVSPEDRRDAYQVYRSRRHTNTLPRLHPTRRQTITIVALTLYAGEQILKLQAAVIQREYLASQLEKIIGGQYDHSRPTGSPCPAKGLEHPIPQPPEN